MAYLINSLLNSGEEGGGGSGCMNWGMFDVIRGGFVSYISNVN